MIITFKFVLGAIWKHPFLVHPTLWCGPQEYLWSDKKIMQPGVPRLTATVQHRRGVPGLCAVQRQQRVVQTQSVSVCAPLVAASLQSTQGACEMEIHGLGLGTVHQQHRRRVLVQYRSSQTHLYGRRALVYRGSKELAHVPKW